MKLQTPEMAKIKYKAMVPRKQRNVRLSNIKYNETKYESNIIIWTAR